MDSASTTIAMGGDASGVIKDTLVADLINKTLDRLNTVQTITGPKLDADYQFQKDVLAAAGIGTRLDTTI